MRYQIAWRDSAAREFDRLPYRTRESVYSALARLALENRGDVQRLQSMQGAYRFRVGSYRVVFTLEGSLMVVHRVVARGGAYRD